MQLHSQNAQVEGHGGHPSEGGGGYLGHAAYAAALVVISLGAVPLLWCATRIRTGHAVAARAFALRPVRWTLPPPLNTSLPYLQVFRL
jgi:hypothetical protein